MKPSLFAALPGLAMIAALLGACRSDASVRAPVSATGDPDRADSLRMMVIPGGSFTMGSPDDEPGRYKSEGPRRVVEIPDFAMAVHEVTRAQYAAFVADTRRPETPGCKTMGDGTATTAVADPTASWRSPGFDQTANHPVVCVSWQDASDYAAWLARKTGQPFRLPSEAEWEYAARAETTTAYYWGDRADRGCAHANSGDASLVRALPRWRETVAAALQSGESGAEIVGCDDGAGFTAPVGSYPPNPFGLHDMLGNAWEWVADCSRPELPTDAGAYIDATCTMHRTRGGSWNDYPRDFRSARRSSAAPDDRWSSTGFRLACSPR